MSGQRRWGSNPPALGPLTLGAVLLDDRKLKAPGPSPVLCEWALPPLLQPKMPFYQGWGWDGGHLLLMTPASEQISNISFCVSKGSPELQC